MNFPKSAKPERPSRILVVDDLPDNQFLIQNILQDDNEDYEIWVEDNGVKALDRVFKTPPDLILLDVMMPEMDGYEVTRRIRASDLPYIPILLITAYSGPSVVKGLDLGADDFIRKPVDPDEIIARVDCLLRLKHLMDEQLRLARQREDFVSRLTHDLRTPLVAADRMLTLISQGVLGELSEPMHEALTTMARSNQNLLSMVNKLLEVYRYEAGRKTLNFNAINIGSLSREVIQELQPLADEKNLHLNLVVDEGLPALQGDNLELRRVLTNLVGNAIKFTDQGEVQVSLRAPSNGLLEIQIRDTGPGIPADDQVHLFESFYQGRHHKGGSGLGLDLCRRIVAAHQGKIRLDSVVGEGTTFTVCLPLQPQQQRVAS
ncbi:hybrid sensor histidine kinase/response regulator [Leptolyngbya sp. FACHB-261]|uniref:hybrid sensor histidine kinase/response regulator n=1 Tax=Leptolyngbya sp. FACHB-261 TaxID=2692806 RepID=UPI00168A0EE6|nr:hybrid sensor histidine kinase/response regulator [Leptolyngbya sp. FACHB-261]MBD2100517.1 hybrid sensor histidine kinase/response regulator [Leptolyngbya sp. FACHB-261]